MNELKKIKNEYRSIMRRMKLAHDRATIASNYDLINKYEGRIDTLKQCIEIINSYLPKEKK